VDIQLNDWIALGNNVLLESAVLALKMRCARLKNQLGTAIRAWKAISSHLFL
jgi:hypothetical protein